MTIPAPTAFLAMVKGYEGECPLLPSAIRRRLTAIRAKRTESWYNA